MSIDRVFQIHDEIAKIPDFYLLDLNDCISPLFALKLASCLYFLFQFLEFLLDDRYSFLG